MKRFVLLSLVVLVASAPIHTKDVKSFDEIVPRDTIVYFSIKDVSSFGKKFNTLFEGLANEKEVKHYLGGFDFSKAVEAFEKEAGFSLKHLCSGFQGEFAFYLEMPILMDLMAGKFPNMGILIDARDNSKDFSKVISTMIEKINKKKGDSKSTEEYEKVEITSFDLGHLDLSFATIDNVFTITTMVSGTKSLIDNYKGNSKKILANNANYKSTVKELDNPDILFYLDTSWISAAVKLAPEKEREAIEVALKTLGITELKGIAAGASATSNAFKIELFVHCPKMPGIFKFAGANKKRSAPNWIPEDTKSIWVGELDWGSLWESIDETAKAVGEKLGSAINIRDWVKMVSGIDLKEDLIDALDKEYLSYQIIKKPYKLESLNGVFALKLKDAKAMTTTIENLASKIPFLTEEKLEDKKFYSFSMPGQDEKFVFGVADNYLFFGDADGVTTTLKAIANPPKETPFDTNFSKISKIAKIPSINNGFGFVGSESFGALVVVIPETIEKLKENPFFPDELADSISEALNLKNLPKSETIEKHIMGAATYSQVLESGLKLNYSLIVNKK